MIKAIRLNLVVKNVKFLTIILSSLWDIEIKTFTLFAYLKTNLKINVLVAKSDESWLWHRRLGHANMKQLSKLSSKNLVRGLPTIKFVKDNICDECIKGKQVKNAFKSKNSLYSSNPLELLHIDLFGPSRIGSLSGKKYAFVIIDDFTRFTWVFFLTHKNDAFDEFSCFSRKVQNRKNLRIICVHSDHGGEFVNSSI